MGRVGCVCKKSQDQLQLSLTPAMPSKANALFSQVLNTLVGQGVVVPSPAVLGLDVSS